MTHATKKLLPLVFQLCILLAVSDWTRTGAELLRAHPDQKGNGEDGLLSWLTSFGKEAEAMFNKEVVGEEEQVIYEEAEKEIFEKEEEEGSQVALGGHVPQYEVYGRDGRVEDILTEKEMEQLIKENNIDEKEAALLRGETVLTEEELEKLIKKHNVSEQDAEMLRALRPYAYGYRSFSGWGWGGWGYGYGRNNGWGRGYYGYGYWPEGFRCRPYCDGYYYYSF